MARNISLVNSTIELNKTAITGWSDDTDALTIPDITISNVKRGADGIMTATATGIKGGAITYKLLAETESCKFLVSISEQIKSGANINFQGTITSNSTGWQLIKKNGVLTQYKPFPTIGAGEKASMEFVIEWESIDGVVDSTNFSFD